MKKTTLLSFIIVLSAVVGALTAMFIYLRKREEELKEYEQILFDGDWEYDQSEIPDVPLEKVEAPEAG